MMNSIHNIGNKSNTIINLYSKSPTFANYFPLSAGKITYFTSNFHRVWCTYIKKVVFILE